MLGKLRDKYQKTITPIGMALAKTGISPNTMTVLSLIAAIVSGYAYALGEPIAGALLIVLTGLLDMLDGAIARASNKVTKFGTTFDHVIDRYAEFFIVFGIIFSDDFDKGYIAGLFALFGMLMASFTRAKAESVGGLRSCTVGIAERQEKLLLIILGSFLVTAISEALHVVLILIGLLSHVTVIQRLHYTWHKTGGK